MVGPLTYRQIEGIRSISELCCRYHFTIDIPPAKNEVSERGFFYGAFISPEVAPHLPVPKIEGDRVFDRQIAVGLLAMERAYSDGRLIGTILGLTVLPGYRWDSSAEQGHRLHIGSKLISHALEALILEAPNNHRLEFDIPHSVVREELSKGKAPDPTFRQRLGEVREDAPVSPLLRFLRMNDFHFDYTDPARGRTIFKYGVKTT